MGLKTYQKIDMCLGSRQIFAAFHAELPPSVLKIACIESYRIDTLGTRKIQCALVMKLLRDDRKGMETEDFLGSNNRIERSQSGLIQIDNAVGYALCHQIGFHLFGFVVRLARVGSANQNT